MTILYIENSKTGKVFGYKYIYKNQLDFNIDQ